MRDAIIQMFIDFSYVIWAPSGNFPAPPLRITIPPENANQAIGFDFSHIAGDLDRSIKRVEHAKQLELRM